MSTPEYQSMREAALNAGVSRAYIHKLLKAGKIPGAVMLHQRAWLIPADWEYRKSVKPPPSSPSSRIR